MQVNAPDIMRGAGDMYSRTCNRVEADMHGLSKYKLLAIALGLAKTSRQ